MQHGEPVVGGVGQHAVGQDGPVPPADPGDLGKRSERASTLDRA